MSALLQYETLILPNHPSRASFVLGLQIDFDCLLRLSVVFPARFGIFRFLECVSGKCHWDYV